MKLFLVLLSLVTLAWGQDRFECHCGMFITLDQGTLEVHRLPRIDLNTCDEANECLIKCLDEWNFLFANGGLDFQRPNSNMTMGEESCRNLAKNFNILNLDSTPVYNYFKLCQDPWMYDGASSQDDLCCEDGAYPGRC